MSLHNQYALINSLDWDFLIILDACRYDVFKEIVPEYMEGLLRKAWSPASNSVDWANRMWTRRYELTYFSANPLINSRGPGLGFNGPGHFSHVVDVWDGGWSDELGTVPPEAINQAVREALPLDKAILHYMQPHGPWIGKTKITIPEEWLKPGQKRAWMDGDLLKRLRIDEATFRRAYRDNLRLVLEWVQNMIFWLHGKVVITADHGELLGEHGLYCHAGQRIASMDVPEIRHVPWFVFSRE